MNTPRAMGWQAPTHIFKGDLSTGTTTKTQAMCLQKVVMTAPGWAETANDKAKHLCRRREAPEQMKNKHWASSTNNVVAGREFDFCGSKMSACKYSNKITTFCSCDQSTVRQIAFYLLMSSGSRPTLRNLHGIDFGWKINGQLTSC